VEVVQSHNGEILSASAREVKNSPGRREVLKVGYGSNYRLGYREED
jgi:hypothetical protein